MGGFSEFSGATDLPKLLVPDPRDLEQKIQCKDEYVLEMSKHLSPQSIRLLTPIWRIRSTFQDLDNDINRSIETLSEVGKDFIDCFNTGFIIIFLIKWIRMRRDPTSTTRRIKMRAKVNYIIHQLVPRFRRLVDKMDKLHCKFLKDARLTAQHPELYAESPLFNPQVQRDNYHRLLVDLRNDIHTYWKDLKAFKDTVVGIQKCGRLRRIFYWKVTNHTICLFILIVAMVVIFKYASTFGFGRS